MNMLFIRPIAFTVTSYYQFLVEDKINVKTSLKTEPVKFILCDT